MHFSEQFHNLLIFSVLIVIPIVQGLLFITFVMFQVSMLTTNVIYFNTLVFIASLSGFLVAWGIILKIAWMSQLMEELDTVRNKIIVLDVIGYASFFTFIYYLIINQIGTAQVLLGFGGLALLFYSNVEIIRKLHIFEAAVREEYEMAGVKGKPGKKNK